MMMRGVVFAGKDCVETREMPRPELSAPTDAIVKVTLAGLCGSDLHPYHEKEKGLDQGTVMGHEFVGVVDSVGSGVTSLRVGDRVCTPFTTSCGGCFYCTSGLPCRCVAGQLFGWRQNGVGLHGGQAEYVLVPQAEGTLVPIPDDVSDEVALFVGDILSTGYHVAYNAGISPASTGTHVLVGCGPVGLMALLSALELSNGAATIVCVDSVPQRLAKAESLGGTPLDYTSQSAPAFVQALTGGRGADGVMECVGGSGAVRTAFECLRPGGVLSSIGVNTDEHLPFSPEDAYNKNLTFRSGRCPARYYMSDERIWSVARKHGDTIKGVVSHRLSLADGPRAYELFDKKLEGCTKVVFVVSSPSS